MAKRPKARRPGPRHGILARPKHDTARQGSGPCRPSPTTGPCLGLSTGTLGRHSTMGRMPGPTHKQ
uniref:Uncharacterized protein n=1 Tax=Oryza sativa subsp. japonica TaxID=39947 RepID=Q6Z4J1_ORYSJ|nr:hypothetical protein [Oryza sativa Japonica Group]BAD31863.1 hypothetical protein [Oryza sativa Japonica Group]